MGLSTQVLEELHAAGRLPHGPGAREKRRRARRAAGPGARGENLRGDWGLWEPSELRPQRKRDPGREAEFERQVFISKAKVSGLL